MSVSLQMAMGAAVLSGCGAPGTAAIGQSAETVREVRISGGATPLGFDEGARAKQLASDVCGPQGVRSSVNDRFEAGTWVFVKGCA